MNFRIVFTDIGQEGSVYHSGFWYQIKAKSAPKVPLSIWFVDDYKTTVQQLRKDVKYKGNDLWFAMVESKDTIYACVWWEVK